MKSIEDLCFSLQEYIFTMLVKVGVCAMARCGQEGVLFIGGLWCNLRLQQMLTGIADYPVSMAICKVE